jgi:predicted peptidase
MKIYIITRLLIAIFISIIFTDLYAQQSVQKFVTETNYLLGLPEHYNDDTTKKWPLLLFLHGSGESGHDIQKVKAHGPPMLTEQGKRFQFIIVSPQSDFPGG